jgi:predicted enzyme related to lactoylglutathione lyase
MGPVSRMFHAPLIALVACSSDGNTTRPAVTAASEPTAEARPVTGAVATPQPDVAAPPHHEAEWNRMPGKWVHFELWTADLARAKAFYGQIFGWTFVDRVSGAAIWHRNRRIGLIQAPGATAGPLVTVWVGHMSSEHVGLPSAVGKVLVPEKHVPEVGRLTVLVDDWGAPFGLIEAEHGDARDGTPAIGDVVWFEHWSRDKKTVEAAAEFYALVGRYDLTWKYPRWITWGRQTARTEYTVSVRDKVARLGYAAAPSPSLAGRFVPYVLVDDVPAAIAAAIRLGGRMVSKPSDQGIATVADPGGAVVGLVRGPAAPPAP